MRGNAPFLNLSSLNTRYTLKMTLKFFSSQAMKIKQTQTERCKTTVAAQPLPATFGSLGF